MGIANRELHPSLQREPFQFNTSGVVTTGTTFVVTMVPYASSLDVAQVVANGVSGAPVGMLYVNRFIPGSGNTTFALGSTFLLVAFGTSGVQNVTVGVSLPVVGATLSTLAANDQIMFWVTGANSAALSISGAVVLRPLNDLTKYFGVF